MAGPAELVGLNQMEDLGLADERGSAMSA